MDDLVLHGSYRHYKGGFYEVVGVGLHTETEERMVIYRALHQIDAPYWVRPYDMFCDNVEIDGVLCPRFTRIEQ